MQDRSIYSADKTSSPMVSLPSLYMVAALAGKDMRHVSTKDVGCAYLNAKMERTVHMTLQPSIAKSLIKIQPSCKIFLRYNGALVV